MNSKRDLTRETWLAVLAKHRGSMVGPDSARVWSNEFDLASRDRIVSIQNEKLRALAPFLYENSAFYRRRFDRLGMLPSDLRSIEDLPRWPVVTKEEMSEDAAQHPPFGTYLTIGDEEWKSRGWMVFSTSGSSGTPRPFRYTHIDRSHWEWANARALQAMGINRGQSVFLIGGFGPHVWLWGVHAALMQMNVAVIPGGGLDATARARAVDRFKPTVIACTPSYALYLGKMMQSVGLDPASSTVTTLFLGGEPGISVEATRTRIESLWNARAVEFYGCTEASPHVGGFSCDTRSDRHGAPCSHLLEDVQIWETVDPATKEPVPLGERGLTVCTSLNSESSPQLRFLVGDFTRLLHDICDCGRSHARALGSFVGRADDLINLRGVKFFPSEIEHVIRSVPGTGDEFEIVLETLPDGLDIMTVRVEHDTHAAPDTVREQIASSIRTRIELRINVAVLPPNQLPKTEFKAKRVIDRRPK